MNRGLVATTLVVGLLVGGCSLAGDVTPPPALATAQMAAPAETPKISPPNTLPDIEAGALIFADKCAACHGSEGLGDGELADGLAFAPVALGDPEVAQSADPFDWYRTVTIGNIDRLMPGFTSLSDQQRWDVVGYALSLGAASEQEIADEIEGQGEPDERPENDSEPEADIPEGSVTGRISNGSAGASLPIDLEVTLLGYDGDQEGCSSLWFITKG